MRYSNRYKPTLKERIIGFYVLVCWNLQEKIVNKIKYFCANFRQRKAHKFIKKYYLNKSVLDKKYIYAGFTAPVIDGEIQTKIIDLCKQFDLLSEEDKKYICGCGFIINDDSGNGSIDKPLKFVKHVRLTNKIPSNFYVSNRAMAERLFNEFASVNEFLERTCKEMQLE